MKWVYFLGYLAMPAVLAIHFHFGRHDGEEQPWAATATFILSCLAIVPLARVIGEATEHLAARTGPTWGGLLNATFGNAAELIIGIVAILHGLNDVAKASLSGSILGNLLLVAGASMLAGGWGRERQTFSRPSVKANAGLLTVAVTGMLLPAIFHFSFRDRDPHLLRSENGISVGTSIVLLVVYAMGLLFTLRTHRHMFAISGDDAAVPPNTWSVPRSLAILGVASVAVAIFSDLLVGSVQQAAVQLRWNYSFVGVILIAIVGNAAEHASAVMLARRNQMDTAMNIAFQSSLQIALFVTPALVLLSAVFVASGAGAARRMNMVFSPLEVASVYLSVVMVVTLSRNGESTWFEGALLLAVYAILAITFFYIPPADVGGYDSVPTAPAADPSIPAGAARAVGEV